jgi:hypothetical protein
LITSLLILFHYIESKKPNNIKPILRLPSDHTLSPIQFPPLFNTVEEPGVGVIDAFETVAEPAKPF